MRRNHFKTAEQKGQDGFGRKEYFPAIGLPWSWPCWHFFFLLVLLDTSWMQEQEAESEMRILLLPIINVDSNADSRDPNGSLSGAGASS